PSHFNLRLEKPLSPPVTTSSFHQATRFGYKRRAAGTLRCCLLVRSAEKFPNGTAKSSSIAISASAFCLRSGLLASKRDALCLDRSTKLNWRKQALDSSSLSWVRKCNGNSQSMAEHRGRPKTVSIYALQP